MPFLRAGVLKQEEKMKRKTRITVLTMIFVLILSVASASALTDSVKFQLYSAAPASVKVAADDVAYLKRVEKYTFTYKGRETFSNFKRLMKSIDGSILLPLSVKWVSSNEDVATVNSYGKITGIKKGSAYVYPLPKGVYSYRCKGRYITYTSGNILGEIKIYGGIGVKVKVTK